MEDLKGLMTFVIYFKNRSKNYSSVKFKLSLSLIIDITSFISRLNYPARFFFNFVFLYLVDVMT